MTDIDPIKYPIGTFQSPAQISDADLDNYIREIKKFPKKLRETVEHMTDEQLNTQYRDGGWTVRQVVNHIADSHTHAFFRFKWALTEDNPTIKPYDEKQWAELQDSRRMPVAPALQMIDGVHARWAFELQSLTNIEFGSTFYHPENRVEFNLKESLAKYVWHGNHHLAQIQSLKERMKW